MIQLKAAELKIEELNKEQESLIDIFSEERDRRETEEKNLRKKLQVRVPPDLVVLLCFRGFYLFSPAIKLFVVSGHLTGSIQHHPRAAR